MTTTTTTTQIATIRQGIRTAAGKIRNIAAAATATFAITAAAFAATSAPASASPAHERFGDDAYGPPYSTPITAIGNRTIATYIAAHQAHDHRIQHTGA